MTEETSQKVSFGKLDPYRSLKETHGAKGERSVHKITLNQNRLQDGETLVVSFPSLSSNDSIIPGTIKLNTEVEIQKPTDHDPNQILIDNYGTSRFTKQITKLGGHIVTTLNHSDVFNNFLDLWRSLRDLDRSKSTGKITKVNSENVLKLRCESEDADKTDAKGVMISKIYGKVFSTLLNHSLINNCVFSPRNFKDPIQIELQRHNTKDILKSTKKVGNVIENKINLEFTAINSPSLSSSLRIKHKGTSQILFDDIKNTQATHLDKLRSSWKFDFNEQAKSLKGVLFLFKDDKEWGREPSKFIYPNIIKVGTTINGVGNKFYNHGMVASDFFNEACKYFETVDSEITEDEYFTDKFGLWVDFRTIDDNNLAGTGRKLESGSSNFQLLLERENMSAGNVMCYVYVITDAAINLNEGRFVSVHK